MPGRASGTSEGWAGKTGNAQAAGRARVGIGRQSPGVSRTTFPLGFELGRTDSSVATAKTHLF